MSRALVAAVVKDLRLLARDRIGLFFLSVAPLIVITVAGLSLASLYGASPRGNAAYLLPIVDEDGGRVGSALRDRLRGVEEVELREVSSRAEALDLVASREAGAGLVVPAGTSGAVERGEPARLLLLTDPVKYLEIANLRSLVLELRHELAARSLEQARRRLDRARARALADTRRLERRLERLRAAAEQARSSRGRLRADLAARVDAARARLERQLEASLAAAEAERAAALRGRLRAELAPLEAFLPALERFGVELEAWLGAARAAAGGLADRLPPPPVPPALPPELEALAHGGANEIETRVLGGALESPPARARAAARPSGSSAEAQPLGAPQLELPRLEIALPPLPEPPAVPPLVLPPVPEIHLPGQIDIEETSVTGAPPRLNTFDQNVPGFSVTFLLLGMLLGVSMALVDERELGTLERARSTPAPVAAVVAAKLLVRFLVGALQMIALLALGRIAFGVSLGPEPWALLLPTAGIVFAGTAFGVLVAGLAQSREAVLPLGSVAIVTMAAVGGCWWPIDLEPRWMREVALAFPTTWAMAAFNDLMIRRQGAWAAVQPTIVMLAFGSGLLALGLALLARRRD